MQIVIKTLTGKDIYLNLHPESTTADLHYALQAKEGLPPGHGRFIFAGDCTSQRSDQRCNSHLFGQGSNSRMVTL